MQYGQWNLRQYIGRVLFKVIRKDKQPGGCIAQDLQQFLPVQPPVEGGMDGADLRAGEKKVQMFIAIPGQDRHPVAFADPL